MKRIPVADVCEGKVGKIKHYTRGALWKAYENEDGYYLKARWTLYPVMAVALVVVVLWDTGKDFARNAEQNWDSAKQILSLHYPKESKGGESD